MQLIIGLGNPGVRFKNTPHSLGFSAIDAFAKINDFSNFKLSKKFNALVSEKDGVILVKPQTFMNESGKAVKKLIANNNLIVVHDDIDLPFGLIKIVKGRGSAGHKGVESIIKELGNEDFIRIRVGVCPKEGKPSEPEKFVLKRFDAKEKDILKATLDKAVGAIEALIKGGLEKAMNEYNK